MSRGNDLDFAIIPLEEDNISTIGDPSNTDENDPEVRVFKNQAQPLAPGEHILFLALPR